LGLLERVNLNHCTTYVIITTLYKHLRSDLVMREQKNLKSYYRKAYKNLKLRQKMKCKIRKLFRKKPPFMLGNKCMSGGQLTNAT
jgi:hypothetical protein